MRVVAVVTAVLVLVGLWGTQAGGIRAVVGRFSVLPFAPLLLAGTALGIVLIGLMWWTASEA
ncbi:MAG: hypothetical protein ACXV78_15770 [Candidatus Angelobacter sp.]